MEWYKILEQFKSARSLPENQNLLKNLVRNIPQPLFDFERWKFEEGENYFVMTGSFEAQCDSVFEKFKNIEECEKESRKWGIWYPENRIKMNNDGEGQCFKIYSSVLYSVELLCKGKKKDIVETLFKRISHEDFSASTKASVKTIMMALPEETFDINTAPLQKSSNWVMSIGFSDENEQYIDRVRVLDYKLLNKNNMALDSKFQIAFDDMSYSGETVTRMFNFTPESKAGAPHFIGNKKAIVIVPYVTNDALEKIVREVKDVKPLQIDEIKGDSFENSAKFVVYKEIIPESKYLGNERTLAMFDHKVADRMSIDAFTQIFHSDPIGSLNPVVKPPYKKKAIANKDLSYR
jgi:hypothetical protein